MQVRAFTFLDMVLPGLISFTVDSVIDDEAPDLPASLLKCLESAGGTAVFKAHPSLVAAAVISVALCAAVCRFLNF